jgi:hypothetical protein
MNDESDHWELLQFKILDSYNFNIFVMNIMLING